MHTKVRWVYALCEPVTVEASKHEAAERERYWIQTHHSTGSKLFNRQMVPGYVRVMKEFLYGDTNAGRIRRALDNIGWDADLKDVQAEIGPVIHYAKGHNRKLVKNRWVQVDDPKPALLPIAYISAIRNKGPLVCKPMLAP